MLSVACRCRIPLPSKRRDECKTSAANAGYDCRRLIGDSILGVQTVSSVMKSCPYMQMKARQDFALHLRADAAAYKSIDFRILDVGHLNVRPPISRPSYVTESVQGATSACRSSPSVRNIQSAARACSSTAYSISKMRSGARRKSGLPLPTSAAWFRPIQFVRQAGQ